ncbi:MAG: hypothetical protein WBR15_02585 [Gammaproteobacteria bacterium]
MAEMQILREQKSAMSVTALLRPWTSGVAAACEKQLIAGIRLFASFAAKS